MSARAVAQIIQTDFDKKTQGRRRRIGFRRRFRMARGPRSMRRSHIQLRPRQLFFFLGTFFPARRASESPIAIACLRLFTFLPLRPLLSVPRLRSCMARSTFLDAPFEYL